MTEKQILDFSKAGANAALFTIDRLPNLQLFCSKINFPGISTQPIQLDLPKFIAATAHSVKMSLNDLSVTFIISETFDEYFEIWQWVKENCHEDIINTTNSNANILLFDNHKHPMKSFSFWDLQPTSLSDLSFDVNSADPITATLTLKCQDYQVRDLREEQKN
jgi:hypothetical protein